VRAGKVHGLVELPALVATLPCRGEAKGFEIPVTQGFINHCNDVNMPDLRVILMHGGNKPDWPPVLFGKGPQRFNGDVAKVQIPVCVLPLWVWTYYHADEFLAPACLINQAVGGLFCNSVAVFVEKLAGYGLSLPVRPVGNVANALFNKPLVRCVGASCLPLP
jgi:hypothetical protein